MRKMRKPRKTAGSPAVTGLESIQELNMFPKSGQESTIKGCGRMSRYHIFNRRTHLIQHAIDIKRVEWHQSDLSHHSRELNPPFLHPLSSTLFLFL